MRLKSKDVVIEYRGEKITCEKSVYACDFCDFELHEEWMKKKLEEQLEKIYNERFAD